jgi:hypothetical protein
VTNVSRPGLPLITSTDQIRCATKMSRASARIAAAVMSAKSDTALIASSKTDSGSINYMFCTFMFHGGKDSIH